MPLSDLLIPYHRVQALGQFTGGGSVPLLGLNQFSPAVFVLEGLDAVNNPVTEGSNCAYELQNSGLSGGGGDIFQCIVYATSQGSFSWRGNMVIFESQSINAIVETGAWSMWLWGHVEPAYTLQP